MGTSLVCRAQEAQPAAAAHEWCQDLPFSEDEAGFMSGKTRNYFVKRARLITYVSLAVTLVGGVSGIAAAVALDRYEHIRLPHLILSFVSRISSYH